MEQETIETPPKKYKMFDGFIKANLLMKFLYIATFPAIAVVIEGLEYRHSQSRLKKYEEKLHNNIQSGNVSTTEDKINKSLTETGKQFQEAIYPANDRSPTRAR